VSVCVSLLSLLGNGSVKIPVPFLGNCSVKTLPQQRIHRQQYKICCMRQFLCGPRRIKENRRLVLPRTFCFHVRFVSFSCIYQQPFIIRHMSRLQCRLKHRYPSLLPGDPIRHLQQQRISSERQATKQHFLTHIELYLVILGSRKGTDFWVVTPCRAGRARRFGGTCSLELYRQRQMAS
jgi:hypothetical protein